MYHEFTISSQAPIYDPEEFKTFCISAGATTISDTVLAAMTSERHSEDRIKTNQQRTVAMLYMLCFGLSQVCNWLQTDCNWLQSNLNQHGLDTVRQMGGSCCRRLAGNLLNHFSNSNHQKISELINDAIQHQWQLVLVIDDFTSIHTRRRTTTDKLSQSKSMCTIIIKVFKNIKAIPACLPSTYHCLQAIDIDACIKTVSGASTMHKLTFTYSSIMPSWIRASFFNAELERHRLATHEYCERETVQSMRQMKDVNLVDFVQLTLKSKNDFEAAFDIVLSTKLADYLKLYLLPQPGDWPAQFYSRQIVYETLLKFSQPVPTCLSSSATNSCNEHTYAVPHGSVPTRQQCTINTSVSPNQPAILSVIPCIGPLHVSLNAQETVFKDFRGFFADVYCKLFPRCQLARSPKPWRISLILELVFGGWLFIRDAVKNKFSVCKDIEYRTLLNLLDNYLPLVLTIYTVTFKLKNSTEYFHGMIRIWTMFLCLERRHYNKAPLVWLAMVTHWGMHHPGLYQMLQSNVVLFDEYPVENAHSIIRARTNDSDTAEQLIQKAKASFQAKQAQTNFREQFTPTKHLLISQNSLSKLKAKCAKILADIFAEIAKHPGNAVISGQGKNAKVNLPRLFGEEEMKTKILPLGHCSTNPPNERKRCDLPSCTVTGEEAWMIFDGCSHSFHLKCMSDDINFCPLCQQFLREKAKQLSETAINAILDVNSKESVDRPHVASSDDNDSITNDEEEASDNDTTNDNNFKELIQYINSGILALSPPPPPSSIPLLVPQQPRNIQEQSTQQSHIAAVHKKPHCRKCGHPRKGHKFPKNRDVQCPQCKDGICASNVCPRQAQPTSHPLTVGSTGNTHWLLPHQIAQSTIFGISIGSNACTVIAVMGARKFLDGQLSIPTSENVLSCIAVFADAMREGNMHYNTLNLPSHQPNLDVNETLQTRDDNFGLDVTEELGLFSPLYLENKIIDITHHQENRAAVLITPPDKSMLLCFNKSQQTIALFESHTHDNNGGLIAACKYNNIHNFVSYLNDMCSRYWGSSLAGANIAILKRR